MRRRGAGSADDLKRDRGTELLWVHATSPERLTALGDIGTRLKTSRPDLQVLVTCEDDLMDLPLPEGCDMRGQLSAGDTTHAARNFLEHFQPDLCLWTGGRLRPNLIRLTRERDVDLLLTDVEPDDIPSRRLRWFTDMTQKMLECFDRIFTASPDAIERLKRAGVSPDRITQTAVMRSSITPPSCNDDELSQVTTALGGRPVWLAANLEPYEFDAVLSAHRTALKRLHRLLLVVAVDCERHFDAICSTLRRSGLRFVDWGVSDRADENTQVILACSEDGLGMWYRLAPLTFLGGSLERGGTGQCPMPALSLGSAILFGPGVRDHVDLYRRLASEGAAIKILGAAELSDHVTRLAAPDEAAAMALAGWKIVTEGAELTDLLVDEVQDRFDLREKRHASA
ncbi:MAG: 3-deoxy-D-manno-octulosonic acid transferase [Rhodobacteraceae bacterium]|nr:3-deoxy-D-manno-octulosonic acid transferase [Paracoccaceae bacterium]